MSGPGAPTRPFVVLPCLQLVEQQEAFLEIDDYSSLGAALKSRASPLTQYRIPVPPLAADGPSGNTCPWCPPHFRHDTSFRPPHSVFKITLPSLTGRVKLGHPDPESYFASEVKSCVPQPAQSNLPGLFSPLRDEENRGSVTFSLSTATLKGLVHFCLLFAVDSLSFAAASTDFLRNIDRSEGDSMIKAVVAVKMKIDPRINLCVFCIMLFVYNIVDYLGTL
mmetsp:Transcript_58339/g.117192  ORF Transcript_58339/g.117192 Transcript_58339/m.117192 type:complete len:222 (-) Transcript_58339:6-671(-)